ncbi:glucose-1-phosphate adenylyltransferase subunit GlgD [Aneurinibacillus sp. Ricciae_BoGa-3]|uniref:glucose-1-phosphate adenylyltransferase subunit GlgD n=1 Tax=Aneurinibacillus sp. Ricciae_BoGa-3 TaxID=3022697 RepID=UPI00233FAF7B|nr:glucose-1-phosphate adenylyltransferase subunit GlgD [Aneurinibacillus sp. Ricciae_BoGa-3]WCK52696.1 glucose-1-phosphate adenylyltransferase subunit GlgD [Aneurinibacillus sp. Ricciae_BoGa-3]
MDQVMGVINLGNEFNTLNELTKNRCCASIPFGGRYRLIDFVLSNMVNSGIQDVAVFALENYRSLMDHLGTGKEWDLARKRGGLFILPPALDIADGGFKGDLQNFVSHLDYFHRGSQKYVLITGSNILCNIDYRQPFLFHQNVGADITVLYKQVQSQVGYTKCRQMEVRDDGWIESIEECPGTKDTGSVSMEMYIIEKSLLIDIIQSCVSRGKYEFVTDGIIKNLPKLKVYGYEHLGYTAAVHTVRDYYVNSMNLLKPEVWKDLFFQRSLIYTKVKDEPPAKYAASSKVENSLVANGCVIEGTVENSILFRGVTVKKGAYIKDSIVMQHSVIKENARLENVIIDKDVSLTGGRTLFGDTDTPLVIPKRKVM